MRARAVLLATGASYRRLGVPALEALNGAGVFYGGPTSEAPAMAGRDVYVLGGANSAGQAALYLARYARRVTLVVRARVARRRDVALSGPRRWRRRQTWRSVSGPRSSAVGATGGWSTSCFVIARSGSEETVDADGLFLMIGARPHTEWLPPEVDRDAQGFVLTGTDLPDDTLGRSIAVRFSSRRACRGSSRPATFDTAP